jgi:pheromone shutdown protein TraB
MKKLLNFYYKLIRSNSGVSSKAYVMVWGTIISTLVLFFYLTMLVIESLVEVKAHINWYEFSSVIASISVLILASVWGKIKGEQYYYENNNDSNQEGGVG